MMDTLTHETDTQAVDTPIAISAADHSQWGCPYCGFRSGYSMLSTGGCATWSCGECSKTCVIMADGITVSAIRFGTDGIDITPELQPHPRTGKPKHGRADIRPENGGEFFRVRGIGLEGNLACFMCGADEFMTHNIAAFVRTKEAGERIADLFNKIKPGGARVDYREYEPDRVQVKIGACNDHLFNLETLAGLCDDGRITSARAMFCRAPGTSSND